MGNVSLMPHQVQALEKTKGLHRCAFFLDMGLGKTFVGSEKMEEIGNDTNLVVCQKSKINDWVEHFEKYYPNYEVYNLTKDKNIIKFNEAKGKNRIGIINYELIYRRKQLDLRLRFTLILDESSFIQNTSAKRTQYILKMRTNDVILLSGTPCSGKYENMYSQLKLLGCKMTKNAFNLRYVNWEQIYVGGFYHKIPNRFNPYKNVDELKERLRKFGAVFMKTEEAIELPETIEINEYTESFREYRVFMKKDYYDFGDFEIIADNPLTKLLRARELCGLYNVEKLKRFQDLIDSCNDRIIVFYNFQSELNKIANIVTKPVSIVSGKIKNLENYEKYPDSVTFCQYQAAAMGLNLQKANRIIYFSLPLSSELFEQSKKRIHRIGQNKPCYYHYMITKNTIEEDILQTLKKRRDFTNELFIEKTNAKTNTH